MPGKANIRRRRRIEKGRRRASLYQEVERRRKATEEKENAEFIAGIEERSRVAEQASTMSVQDQGLDSSFEIRENER